MYYDMGVVNSLEDKLGSLCIKKEQKMPRVCYFGTSFFGSQT
jgi:hypothetical protein